jgi:hypothetical protein
LPCNLRSSRSKVYSLLASAVMLVTDSGKTEDTSEPLSAVLCVKSVLMMWPVVMEDAVIMLR